MLPTTLRFLTLFFRSYFCFIGPFNYISLYEGLLQPCGWLGLKHQLTIFSSLVLFCWPTDAESDMHRKSVSEKQVKTLDFDTVKNVHKAASVFLCLQPRSLTIDLLRNLSHSPANCCIVACLLTGGVAGDQPKGVWRRVPPADEAGVQTATTSPRHREETPHIRRRHMYGT